MPWCPNCKTEYEEEIATCADCGTELVAELIEGEALADLFYTKVETLADKFLAYLEYSDVPSGQKTEEQDEENDVYWGIAVATEDCEKAQKLFAEFIVMEKPSRKDEAVNQEDGDSHSEEEGLSQGNEEITQEDEEVKQEDEGFKQADGESNPPVREMKLFIREGYDYVLSKADVNLLDPNGSWELDTNEHILHSNNSGGTYVKAEDKFKDHLFSAYTFLVFGLVGCIFIMLNMVGTLSIIAAAFSQYVMLAIFLGFFIVGVVTYRKANLIKATISDEERLTDEVKAWLQAEITPEYLDSLLDGDATEEENFFTQTEEIRDRLMEHFDHSVDVDLADALIEEYLDSDQEER